MAVRIGPDAPTPPSGDEGAAPSGSVTHLVKRPVCLTGERDSISLRSAISRSARRARDADEQETARLYFDFDADLALVFGFAAPAAVSLLLLRFMSMVCARL